ncbi:hypothetical protein HUG15_19710 [Salicibibacter cibarius]|uniref:Uncharacterized protein n=2 Tax=Salicibibacter cibarius TaxID=2743000 RepID=A0A7T6Z694_9BACI|nr:hypothetical protein HUG15_19710 [Salicibibacter cibarius]
MKMIVLLAPLLVILAGCGSDEITEIVDKEDILEQDIACDDPEKRLESNVHNITGQFSEGEMNELKERLNGSVLHSQEALEQEMETLSAHACLNLPEDDYDTEAKMEMYLYMLEYYYTIMESDDDIKVDSLTFEELDYRVYQVASQLDNEKQLEITFFMAENARSRYIHLDGDESSEEMYENALSDNELMWGEIFDGILLVLADPITRVSSQISGYLTAESEREWKREIVQTTTNTRSMELQFAMIEGDGEALFYDDEKVRKIEIYPTSFTYDILDRWEEVHDINPDIPYPEEHIDSEDWLEIDDFYVRNLANFRDIDDELSNYISGRSIDDGRTVEEIANGVE